MKKFLIKLSCFLAIQIGLCFFFMWYGSRDLNSNEYLYSLKDKYDLLQETTGPRVIFIGGSNLAFGIHSPLIQQQTGYTPVNMGVHGGLGLATMLRLVRDQIREGDIVVLSPEVAVLVSRPQCGENIAIEAIAAWPGIRPYLQPDFEQSLDELAPPRDPMHELASRVATALKRLKGRALPEHISYRRDSFNEFGDHVAHYGLTPERVPKDDYTQVVEAAFMKTAAAMNEFHQFCAARNAAVFYLHPPIRETNSKNSPEVLDQMDLLLKREIDFPMLTQWRSAILADTMFFDSKFHLNEMGAKTRSKIICQLLDQDGNAVQADRQASIDEGLEATRR